MGADLNFWKYQDGISLDNAVVYEKACCNQEHVEGLADLPIAEILNEMAAAFADWNAIDLYNYEKKEGQGSFQITATPQAVRFDCYAMEQAQQKRFSAIMAKFGCPLYDPQLSVRFDKIVLFLIDEAGEYRAQVEQEFARLLPRFEVAAQVLSWEEYVQRAKKCGHIHYNAVIHRAKSITKVTSFMQFGNAWANRPCQCKTAQLADEEQAHGILAELLRKSIGRVVGDFLERTSYE